MTLENIASRPNNDADTRRLLEMTFAQTRMALCVTDPHRHDNPIIAINDAFTRLTGYEEPEVLGRNCRFLQGEGTEEAEIARIREVMRDRGVGYFKILNYKKDGTPFWNALHVSSVFSKDGRLLYYFGSQWDVTEKVEAIRALEGEVRLGDERLQGVIDEANRLRVAIDQANDAMILTDYAPIDPPGPRIVWANRGFERMTGYTREEVIGQTPRMFQGPETGRESLDPVRRALEAGRAMPSSETVNYKKDGTSFHLEWSISPVGGPDGEPRYWLSVQRDVSERIETERKLRLLSDELNHRHKNVLAVVTALQQLLPVEGLTAAQYRDALNARMQALSAAHDAVFAGETERARAGDVAMAVLAPFRGDRLRISADDASIGARPALDMALMLHELATNAAKHGALSVRGGRVELALSDANGAVHLDWHEHGGPTVGKPTERGFGFTLLRGMAKGGGRDDAGLKFDPDGLRYRASLRAT